MAIHGFLAPSEKAAASQSTRPVDPANAVSAVLLGGSEDTRLLLRGLLRLHRHQVLLEAQGPEGIERLPSSPETKVLIVDAGSKTDGTWVEDLCSVLRSRPDFRALVILPTSDPTLETRAREAGAQAVLVRPFAIRDFVEAVDLVAAAAAPP
jgi:CheY-like chemotaxis protein